MPPPKEKPVDKPALSLTLATDLRACRRQLLILLAHSGRLAACADTTMLARCSKPLLAEIERLLEEDGFGKLLQADASLIEDYLREPQLKS